MLGTATGTLGVLNAAVALSTDDTDRFSVQLTGTWAGTVIFEVSNDNTNWVSVALVNSTSTALTTGVVSTTANGLFYRIDAFSPFFRVRMSVYTSGTVNVNLFSARSAK